MKEETNYLIEKVMEDDSLPVADKKSLVNFIMSTAQRSANEDNDRPLLLLIAALSMLNVADDAQVVSFARRLAQMSTNVKKKKEK